MQLQSLQRDIVSDVAATLNPGFDSSHGPKIPQRVGNWVKEYCAPPSYVYVHGILCTNNFQAKQSGTSSSWEFMQEWSACPLVPDPFIITSARALERQIC